MTACTALRRSVLTFALMLALALLPAGPGKPLSATHAQPQAPPDGEITAAAQRELARRLHRVAEGVVRRNSRTGEVPPHALQRAETLIAFALERYADDEIGWRRRAELARLRGDTDALREALENIVRVNPRDDAAQLEFILLRFADIATVDGRLDRIERFLDSRRSRDLSAALRSRLASSAARLALEIQDRQRFARRLTEALRLDEYNVEAAEMLLDFARRRNAAEVKRLSATVSLITAAPLRPAPRLDLALALARHAAYEEAHEQFAVASNLFQPRALPVDSYRLWILSLAAEARLEEAGDLLDQLAARARARRTSEAGAPDAGGAPAADAENQNKGRLESQGDTAAPSRPSNGSQDASPDASSNASPSDGESAAEPKLDRADLLGGIDPQLLVLDAVIAEPGSQRRSRSFAEVSRLILETSGDELATAVDEITRIAVALDAEVLEVLDAEVRRAVRSRRLFRAFEAMREGEEDLAARRIGPLVEAGDEPLADYLAARLESGRRDAERAMKAVIRSAPTSLAAMLAGQWLTTRDEDIAPTSVGLSVRQMMFRRPNALWRMNLQTSPWIDLHLTIAENAYAPYDEVPATITLRNDGDMRLTFDRGAAIPARALLRVSLNPGERSAQRLPPDVIDLDRRLALDPDEELEFVWPLSRGWLGRVVTQAPFTTFVFNARLIADPRTLSDGRIVMGPLGDRDDVRGRIVRGASAESAELLRMAQRLSDGVSVDSLHEAATLVSALREASGVQLSEEQRDTIVEALGEHVAAAGDAALAWMLCVIPPGQELGLDRVWQLARRSETPLVQCLLLERHVEDPEDPALSQVLRNGGESVKAYARALRASLEAAAEETGQP